MADAWTTVVHREPEWDETSRTLAIAGVLAEQIRCPKCGNLDTVVEVPRVGDEMAGWGIDGRQFRVRRFRCQSCAGAAVAERDLNRKHQDDKEPAKGRMSPTDATWFRVEPHTPRQRPSPVGGAASNP